VAELHERFRWLRELAPEGRFLNVYMDQNNKCNLKCRMCGFSDPRVDSLTAYDMPRELYESIAAQLFPRIVYLSLSLLTEPFMTRDFPDRCDAVREYGVPFSDIVTNGTLLTPRAIEKLIDARISRLTVSIDGGTKELYEHIRRGARFENVIRNIALFQSMRRERGAALPRLRIHHVLSDANIHAFDSFLDLVEELGPEMIEVRTLADLGQIELRPHADPKFWSQVPVVRAKLEAFCARTGIEDAGYLRPRPSVIEILDEGGNAMMCRRPWDTLALHANGDAHICMGWAREPLGNFALQTFEEIWGGAMMRKVRAEFEEQRPGIDCLNCTICSDPGPNDLFYRKLAKQPPVF